MDSIPPKTFYQTSPLEENPDRRRPGRVLPGTNIPPGSQFQSSNSGGRRWGEPPVSGGSTEKQNKIVQEEIYHHTVAACVDETTSAYFQHRCKKVDVSRNTNFDIGLCPPSSSNDDAYAFSEVCYGAEFKDSSSLIHSLPKQSSCTVRQERDVIGEERSPISKSKSSSAVYLSLSSSGESVPRERKKWTRPPGVGQAASTSDTSLLMNSSVFERSDDNGERNKKTNESYQSLGSAEQISRGKKKSSYFDCISEDQSVLLANREAYLHPKEDDRNVNQISESDQGMSDHGGRVSPSSSAASSRRLEWDSGADVGYNQDHQVSSQTSNTMEMPGFCDIEKMALAQGCSGTLRLRLDPEGTTVPVPAVSKSTPSPNATSQSRILEQVIGLPSAESTPIERIPVAPQRCKKDDPGMSPIVHSVEYFSKEVEQNVDTRPDAFIEAGKTYEEKDELSASLSAKKMSSSMQDLRMQGQNDCKELCRSVSDPDLSATELNPLTQSIKSKSQSIREMTKSKPLLESHLIGNYLSSGSDATLIHIEQEDGSVSKTEESGAKGNETSSLPARNVCGLKDVDNQVHSHNAGEVLDCCQVQGGSKGSRKSHFCSDTDHRRGLHHHFGVVCSASLGSNFQPVVCPNSNENREPLKNPDGRAKPSGGDLEDSAGSSTAHSDSVQEDRKVYGDTLTMTGHANSFEYLPGHLYQSGNSGTADNDGYRCTGVSTSTETDSEPVRPKSRIMLHQRITDSSSFETEEDRLWGSDHPGSDTLVKDLERGVSLLKGVVQNKSTNIRAKKREVIRRVISRLLTSEYLDDFLEKDRINHIRKAGSPRKSKSSDRYERLLCSKRAESERQEISGESDVPSHALGNRKQNVPKLKNLQESVSSSLVSSQAESTSGSISAGGKLAANLKTIPPAKQTSTSRSNQTDLPSTWMKPVTQSEKLFEIRRKNKNVSSSEKRNVGINATDAPVLDFLRAEHSEQLFWVKSEINHLKVLKELLQKRETLKQSIESQPLKDTAMASNFREDPQFMRMADCPSQEDLQYCEVPAPRSQGSTRSRNSQMHDVDVASTSRPEAYRYRTVNLSDADHFTDGSEGVHHKTMPESCQSSRTHIGLQPRRRVARDSEISQRHCPSAGFPTDNYWEHSQRHGSRGNVPKMSRMYVEQSADHPENRFIYPDCEQNFHPNAWDPSVDHFKQMDMRHQLNEVDRDSRLTGPKMSFAESLTQKSRVVPPYVCSSTQTQNAGYCGSKSNTSTRRSSVLTENNPSHSSYYTDCSDIPQSRQPDNTRSELVDDNQRLMNRSYTEKRILKKPISDDSMTKIVTEAVSTKVKALKNLGKIEEAEVNIKVKVGHGFGETIKTHTARIRRPIDLDDDHSSFASKQSDMDRLISRQRTVDQETRQKLLALSVARRRSLPTSSSDLDRQVQELLIDDYINRHRHCTEPKLSRKSSMVINNVSTSPRERMPVSSTTVRKVATQTILDGGNYGAPEYPCRQPSQPGTYGAEAPEYFQPRTGTCDCSCTAEYPDVANEIEQATNGYDEISRGKQITPLSPRRSSTPTPGERHVEFEMTLTKEPSTTSHRPLNLSPNEVHHILKNNKNTAYFLQFEEIDAPPTLEEPEPTKEPLEVVTLQIPKRALGKSKSENICICPPAGFERSEYAEPLENEDIVQIEGRLQPKDGPCTCKRAGRLQPKDGPCTCKRASASSTIRRPWSPSRKSKGSMRSSKSYIPKKKGTQEKKIIDLEPENQSSRRVFKAMAFHTDGNSGDFHLSSGSTPAEEHGSVNEDRDSDTKIPSLQEYLEKNYPSYLNAAETRRRCIAEISYLRRLRQQSRRRLVELEGDAWRLRQKQQRRFSPRSKPVLKRKFSPKSMKSMTSRKCLYLPEVQQRKMDLKRKEERRTNRLMAEIYNKKLQEKVLMGTTTLRSNASIISTI